ncbi:hypothetical protein D1007_27742 [Hordeum vulgare]|nr:hypothetical protein D1007_27742 [Hordeum vulgare]
MHAAPPALLTPPPAAPAALLAPPPLVPAPLPALLPAISAPVLPASTRATSGPSALVPGLSFRDTLMTRVAGDGQLRLKRPLPANQPPSIVHRPCAHPGGGSQRGFLAFRPRWVRPGGEVLGVLLRHLPSPSLPPQDPDRDTPLPLPGSLGDARRREAVRLRLDEVDRDDALRAELVARPPAAARARDGHVTQALPARAPAARSSELDCVRVVRALHVRRLGMVLLRGAMRVAIGRIGAPLERRDQTGVGMSGPPGVCPRRVDLLICRRCRRQRRRRRSRRRKRRRRWSLGWPSDLLRVRLLSKRLRRSLLGLAASELATRQCASTVDARVTSAPSVRPLRDAPQPLPNLGTVWRG